MQESSVDLNEALLSMLLDVPRSLIKTVFGFPWYLMLRRTQGQLR